MSNFELKAVGYCVNSCQKPYCWTNHSRSELNCFRCDGKGKYMNQFGIMEKCASCQKPDMSFDNITPESNLNEEGLWVMRIGEKIKEKR